MSLTDAIVIHGILAFINFGSAFVTFLMIVLSRR